MKEFYLHIGMPRTATTYLQDIIFNNLPLHYQHDIAHEEWKLEEGKNLLSNEGICGKPYQKSKLDRLAYFSYFSNFRPKPHVILGIRNQESLHKSMYTIFVKAGFSGTYQQAKEILNYKYNVDNVIDTVNSYFDNVYCYHFEDFVRSKQNVIKGICDYIGVDTPEIKETIVNVKLTKRQLLLCRTLNKLITQTGKFHKSQGLYCNRFLIGLLQENEAVK